MAKLQTRCHVLADRAEVAPHPLPDRLQKRSARLSARMPTHSLLQWSTATKTWATPSTKVTVWLMTVPHMTSTASVVMVPSCILSGRLRTRCGASNPFSRIGAARARASCGCRAKRSGSCPRR